MELIADGLLIAAAATAALYCWVLSRRLAALRSLDKGLGGAIASLSRQVEETRASLAEAKRATGAQTRELRELTGRAEVAAGRLEMLLATLHKRDGAAPVDPEGVAARRDRARRPAERAAGAAGRGEGDPAGGSMPAAEGAAATPPARRPGAAAAPAPKPDAAPAHVPAPDPRAAGGPAREAAEDIDPRSALIARLRGLAQASGS